MLTFHIITIFPPLFEGFISESIIKRAIAGGKISVQFHNPRDYTTDTHKKTDDRPYGGGPGMVMLAEPLLRAVEAIRFKIQDSGIKIFILSPRGKRFTNIMAQNLAHDSGDIILICGRYEGIDARVKKILCAQEISIGPYTLTGGEVPAMVVIDAITRRLSGVLGNADSLEEFRVASQRVYTRPEHLRWEGKSYRVPKTLLSGDHDLLEKWRKSH